MLEKNIQNIFAESIAVKQATLQNNLSVIARVAEIVADSLRLGRKLLLCGNGGSAADSQHIAAEFVGRFQKERKAWPAIALTTDTSALTALGNDYAFDIVFSRQVEALGNAGDVLFAISTSGNSKNVIAAVHKARAMGIHTVGFTGGSGGELAQACDSIIIAASSKTARIQETHITIFHSICEIVENALTSS